MSLLFGTPAGCSCRPRVSAVWERIGSRSLIRFHRRFDEALRPVHETTSIFSTCLFSSDVRPRSWTLLPPIQRRCPSRSLKQSYSPCSSRHLSMVCSFPKTAVAWYFSDPAQGIFFCLYFLLLIVIAQDKRDHSHARRQDFVIWVASVMMVFTTAVSTYF